MLSGDDELLRSLEEPTDEDVVGAWTEELERRLADVRSGAVELADWNDVRARLAARRAAR